MSSRPSAPPMSVMPSRWPTRVASWIGVAALLAALSGPAAAEEKPLAISPSSATPAAGSKVTFKASGGAGGYKFSLTENGSGGSVAASGEYTAGSRAGTDEVTVTDSAGGTQVAEVHVQAPGQGTTNLGGHR